MNSNTQKYLLYGALLGSLLMGKFVPQINVIVASGLCAWVVFQKRLDLLPLLFLANLPVTAFNLSSYGTYEGAIETYRSAYISFAGLPISAGLVTVVCMAAICGLNFVNDPARYYPGALRLLFFLWILGAGISLLIALNGIMNGHRAWSGPLRGFLSLVGLFYGYGLTLRRADLQAILYRDMLVLSLVLGVLGSLGVFHHRLVFIFCALVPAFSMSALRQRQGTMKILGLCNLVVWAYMAGFHGMTLTKVGLYAMSLSLGAVDYLRILQLRRAFGYLFGSFMVGVIAIYMSVAMWGAEKFNFQDVVFSGAETTLMEDILFKIFDDRAKLWTYVWQDIMRDNWIIPVSGESLLVFHPKRGEVYVRHGAHNSYLQGLRENGLIAGAIIIIIMAYTLVKSAQVYRISKGGFTSALAAGSIPTLTVGAVTGHYVIGQTAGAFIFLLAGLAISKYALPQGEVMTPFPGPTPPRVRRG